MTNLVKMTLDNVNANKTLEEDLKKYEEISTNNSSENPQEISILKQKIVESMIIIDKNTLFKNYDNRAAGTVNDISKEDVANALKSTKLSFDSGTVLMNIINEAKEKNPTPVSE